MRRLAAIMAMGNPPSSPTNALKTSLVSYWKLDEASGTRADSFGSNNLTDNNSTGSTTGKINSGANFVTASSNYLSCASNSTLQMSSNTSFTIQAWINLATLTDQQLVTKDDSAANSRDFTLDYHAGGDGPRLYLQGGGTYIVVAGVAGSASTWYHVVAWYDSTNGQLHMKINDGAVVNSAIGATGTDVSAAQFRIGARQYTGFEGYANGVIDEVGLWKRVLSNAEITMLYNSGAGFPYSSFGTGTGIGTQVVADDFNRANQNPIVGNWSNGTGAVMTITSNTAQPTTFGAADSDAIWNTWASGNDQYSQAEITIVGTGAGSGLGVYARHTSVATTQTGYRVVIDASGNYEVLKLTAGAGSSLRTGTVTYVAGRKLGLSATGGATTTLKVWYNGVQIGANITDSSSPFTTGVPGIAYSSALTSGNIDNWDAGTVP